MRTTTTCGLALAMLLAACGGGGGGTSNAGVALPSQPAGSSPATISPSNSSGGAKPITITEYSLGATPSNGGIAIAKDGSVWTESNGASNTATFVRWYNGAVSAYPINYSNGFSPFTSSGLLTSAGSKVYAIGLQDQGEGNYLQQAFSINDAGGAVTPQSNGQVVSAGGTYGSVVNVISTKDASVWEAVSYPSNGCCSGGGNIVQVAPGNGSIGLPTGGSDTTGFTYDLPTALAEGPDGNFWVAVQEWQNVNNSTISVIANDILVYSKTGALLHTFPIKTEGNAMVAGPDGAVWFTMSDGEVGRITTGGSVSYYPSQTTTGLGGITVGSDRALWFLEPGVNRLGRMTTTGVSTDYAIPTANSNPDGIAGPPNGCQPYTLWFAEAGSGKIAVVSMQ